MERVVVTSDEELKRIVREVVAEELGRWLERLGPASPSYEEPLVTRKEMAAFLNISLVTLGEWVRQGLPCIRKGGRVLFLRSEVLAAMKEKPMGPKAKKGGSRTPSVSTASNRRPERTTPSKGS